MSKMGQKENGAWKLLALLQNNKGKSTISDKAKLITNE